MAEFSASDVALTGFRIVRERPRVLAIWIVVQIVIQLAMTVAMIQLAGPALSRFAFGGTPPSRDPAQAMAILQQLGPFYLLILVFSLVFYPIVFSTMNRAVLRPEEEGFGYIRFGADELRQIGLFLLIFVLGIGVYIAFIIAMVVVFAAVGAVVGLRATASGTAASMGVGIIAAVLLIAGWIYLWVRLSLASPLTFASRRVDLFGSWRLTRGRFWPMFGAYLVATILAIVVSLLTFIISSAISAVVGGGVGGLASVMHPDMSSLSAYLTPARIVQVLVNGVSTALVWPVLLTPAAAIYKSLPEATDVSRTASAFD